MHKEIVEKLRLTAVGCPPHVSLPSLEFVGKTLGRQLDILGMSNQKPEVTNVFERRSRNDKDPSYSLDALRESRSAKSIFGTQVRK
jgi:hypothetical protein